MGGQHHTGPWSNEDRKLVNLCPGSGRMSLRRPKPPIKGGSAPEEEEEEEEEEEMCRPMYNADARSNVCKYL